MFRFRIHAVELKTIVLSPISVFPVLILEKVLNAFVMPSTNVIDRLEEITVDSVLPVNTAVDKSVNRRIKMLSNEQTEYQVSKY